ncbi:MAG: tRNA-intron lyase [Candidatus Nanohalarchaeota archaeon]|nr:MAG: tRNA-intron lyase [Candidatus Nanohaloarchaeota archaeon]
MKPIEALFLDENVYIFKEKDAQIIHDEKYFGKYIEFNNKNVLQLSVEETLFLIELERIVLKDNSAGKILTFEKFYAICSKDARELYQKYRVYRDLRKRGYIVKSGFKFGTHFRVYDKGVNPYKQGDKSKKEHTKYNVHAVSENDVFAYYEVSRYVRLSHNIRSVALMGVVDCEGEVTYYTVCRIKP